MPSERLCLSDPTQKHLPWVGRRCTKLSSPSSATSAAVVKVVSGSFSEMVGFICVSSSATTASWKTSIVPEPSPTATSATASTGGWGGRRVHDLRPCNHGHHRRNDHIFRHDPVASHDLIDTRRWPLGRSYSNLDFVVRRCGRYPLLPWVLAWRLSRKELWVQVHQWQQPLALQLVSQA